MTTPSWQSAHGAGTPSDLTKPFTIKAYPKTDIWRPTADEDVFNAPSIYTSVQSSAFKRISVTVSANWRTLYDQGGLVLAFPRTEPVMRWIKAGIEVEDGRPMLGVVGTDRFSDWSLCPMAGGETSATFEFVRDGATLRIFVVRDGTRQTLREVKWAFLDSQPSDPIHVGVYAAKPTPDEGDPEAAVEVLFKDLKLETSQ